MSKGIAVPFRARNGRLVLSEGAEEMKKIVMLAVGERDNTNPFNQAVGIEHPLFALSDEGSFALARRDIEDHFAKFEAQRRAKLGSVKTGELSPGESAIEVAYVDLDTDSEKTLTLASTGGK